MKKMIGIEVWVLGLPKSQDTTLELVNSLYPAMEIPHFVSQQSLFEDMMVRKPISIFF